MAQNGQKFNNYSYEEKIKIIDEQIIFLPILINGEVFREVTLICGWATVELEIFSDIEGKKLKKLLNSEIIIKN